LDRKGDTIMAGAILAILMMMKAAPATTPSQRPANGAAIACNRIVIREAWDLLRLARYGQSQQERAGFVIADPAGRLRVVRWNYTSEFHRATWSGTIPAGVVAIIHTHPNTYPFPSEGDRELARRSGIPVYVLTREMIVRTTGKRVERVLTGDWNPGRGGSGRCSMELARVDVAQSTRAGG